MKRPLLDRVLVKALPKKDYQFLVTGMQSRESELKEVLFEVVATGSGIPMGGQIIPHDVKEGDIVTISPFARERVYLDPLDEYKHDLPSYYLIRAQDIYLAETPNA